MTEQNIIKVNCPACFEDNDFRIYSQIDSNKNPELKNKIFNREIFRFTCPECGEEILVAYPCTYHDPRNKFIIALVPESDDFSSLRIEGHSLRVVRSINEFVEKIAAFEDNVDDKVIELYKIMLEDQFEDEKPDSKILGIYYGGRDFAQNSLMFFVITENAENCRAYLSMQTYEAIEKQFADSCEKYADVSEVNRLWAIGVLQSQFDKE